MEQIPANLITTGKASKMLAVTPDTVLKWIKQKKLPALRTAGGHYRIAEESLHPFMAREEFSLPRKLPPETNLQYCWEFFSENETTRQGCHECLVYRAHALKCFELIHVPRSLGFKGKGCPESCERCAYFHYHMGRPFKILVITDNAKCRKALTSYAGVHNLNFQFVSCEYESSFVIDRFRPDFVVVDCAMEQQKCRELCHHLANDPRIPGTTLILASPRRRPPLSISGALRIQNPILLPELESALSLARMCHKLPEHTAMERKRPL